ncbi:BatA domain-containing protein [Longibacter sp.]|uniref:BatA domain-containing protein n=1 Tax=Longibacter sp. TaxID=2045415 RepID=UPI003EC0FA9E
MSFLNPFVLLALATIAIPLLLHLFNLRRPQRVDFSSLSFVKELQKSAVQRVRIKQWLLLALRMLAIACLVLAFAQPTLTGGLSGVGEQIRTAHAVVVDNSLSMTMTDVDGDYLAQARAKADDVIASASEGDDVVVWPTAREDGARPTMMQSLPAARDAVGGIEPAAGASAIATAVVQAARALSESTAPRKVVYVASDLQRSMLGDSTSTPMPEGVATTLLPVGTRSQSNVGVIDVQVRSRIVEVGQAVEIEATLVNHGEESRPGAVASVYLDGDRVAQSTADLEPGEPARVTFAVSPASRGWLTGHVEIEDDAFMPDNTRPFILHVPEERRVLVVRGEGQRTRYVDLALSSEMIADRLAFRTETIPEADLPSADLGQYDAVLLVGLQSVSSGEVNSVRRYVERGGGVMVFPGARSRPDEYGDLFGALGGGSFRGFSGELGARRAIATFERVDIEHPLFDGVFDTEGGGDGSNVESPDVYYAMNTPTAGARGQTLIELSNGFPFLQELRAGSGVALVSAVAPDPEWSDLPVRGLFIPLLYRSVYYLSAGTSVSGETIEAGASSELRITGISPEEEVRLVGPDGVDRVPEQRSLFGATLLNVGAELHTTGIYDVMAGDRVVRRLAVAVPSAESNLATAPLDEAQSSLRSAIGGPVDPLVSDASESVATALEQQRAGTEIWNVFLLLALLFLVSEQVLARLWQPETVSA